MRSRGFTLIELIVVVAIIAVLATITVDYLGQKRNKGSDAAVQSNMTNARPQAELYYNNNDKSYEGVCTAADGIATFVHAAATAYGITPQSSYDDADASVWNQEICHDTDTSYVVWVPLRDSTSGSPMGWCTDSRNMAARASSVASGAFFCP